MDLDEGRIEQVLAGILEDLEEQSVESERWFSAKFCAFF